MLYRIDEALLVIKLVDIQWERIFVHFNIEIEFKDNTIDWKSLEQMCIRDRHKASLQQDLSAVTAACMMVKREVFFEVNGFEEKLTVAFNDVDFCLRVRRNGYLVVYDPYAELYHYESKSRGTEDSKEKVRRFQSEIEFKRCRWETLLKEGDPYYNKNLSLTKWNYSLRPKE